MKKKAALLAGIAAAAALSGATPAAAQVYPPGDDRSLDVTAFESSCIDDAPYVVYDIVPVGFTPDPPIATLTVTDINGDPIMVLTNQPLSGKFLFPGSAIDENGKPTDWPGWVKEADGTWREQSIDEPGSDAIWRKGLNIRVDVNPTAFVDPPVIYPDGTPFCLGPNGEVPTSGQMPGTQTGSLPNTGAGGIDTFVQVGLALLAGGGLLVVGAHRRRAAAAA